MKAVVHGVQGGRLADAIISSGMTMLSAGLHRVQAVPTFMAQLVKEHRTWWKRSGCQMQQQLSLHRPAAIRESFRTASCRLHCAVDTPAGYGVEKNTVGRSNDYETGSMLTTSISKSNRHAVQ